jgi:hypothetical protein
MGLILFMAGGIVALITIYRFNRKAVIAAKKLELTMKSEGVNWRCASEPKFRWVLLSRPHSILKPDDSESVSLAKHELISIRERLPATILIAGLFVIAGMLAAIATNLF